MFMTSPWVDDTNAALLTDFYELTMLESYFQAGMNGTAVFDLFVRRVPRNRNYLVACGLEHVLGMLETFSFSQDAIDYLRSLGKFSEGFLDSLSGLCFTGDVYAMPEGTIAFGNEPLVEIIAPLPQAQIVETLVMNQIQLGTMAASKAARVIHAAQGRSVVDFGLRRMHGADAGIKASRAFYIAGIDGTSNVLAAKLFGIPVAGTMAHSYIQAFDDESDAFRHFITTHSDAIILVDTYDTLKGVEKLIQLAREMGSRFRISGIRLDSGDLGVLSHRSRELLNRANLPHVKIFVSSSLDENAVDELVRGGAPIDGFGVGTLMGTSADAPFLDTAYKLVEYAGKPRVKLAPQKTTLPGRKQVFRETQHARLSRDVLARSDEKIDGRPLLVKVMEGGRRVGPVESLDACRARCKTELARLPESLLSLNAAEPYRVEVSAQLSREFTRLSG